jgi:hypothetical protein
MAIALASCSADPGANEVAPTLPKQKAPAPPEMEAQPPMTRLDPLFREDFRLAYSSVLWTMMFLRWCDARWTQPQETARAESRLAAIEAQAISLGLKQDMEQAARDNGQRMSTMRLDAMCNGGFERSHKSAQGALSELEGFMRRRAKEAQPTDGQAQGPPQAVRIAYLGVDAQFFSLQACREESILRAVRSARSRFQVIERQIARRLGAPALTSLRDHARMQSAVIMVQQCAGDVGVKKLGESLDRLAAALAPSPESN